MSEATCKTCPWWARYADRVTHEDGRPGEPGAERSREHPLSGECRKLPPKYSRVEYDIGEPEIGSTFPVTNESEWCGDHPAPRTRGTCENCEYGHEYRTPYMQCRRARPVGYGYRREDGEWKQAWGWPMVNPDDVCGEWERCTSAE